MNRYRYEMWLGDRKILLSDVLKRLSTTAPVEWLLIELHGTGNLVGRKGMVELENEVCEASGGLALSTTALDQLADSLTDIYDLRLIGARNDHVVIEIAAIDSGWWEIYVDSEQASFVPVDIEHPW